MFGSKKDTKQQAQQRNRYIVETMPGMPRIPLSDKTIARVTDLFTGQTVYSGTDDVCAEYAEQWNAGNPQAFLAWQQLAYSLLERQLQEHRRPWRFESTQSGETNVISFDDYIIATVGTAETAAWIVQMVNESDE